jgi:hypothetical protein
MDFDYAYDEYGRKRSSVKYPVVVFANEQGKSFSK